MFNALRLRNFRSFADTRRIPLRPLTLIVGPNNAGKSTLLNAMLLLRQSLSARSMDPLVTSGDFIDLGSFMDILRGGPTSEARDLGIELELDASVVQRATSEYPDRKYEMPLGDRLAVRFSFDATRDQINLDSADFFAGRRRTLGVLRNPAVGDPTSFELRGPPAPVRERCTPAVWQFLPNLGFPDVDPADKNSMVAMTWATDATIQSAMWMQAIHGIEHVDPLRQPVPRFTILGRSPAASAGAGAGGEMLLRLFRPASRAQSNGQQQELMPRVDYWISKRLRLLRELRLEKVDRAGRILALIGDERKGFSDINVANMGEGISQLLPIIANILTLEDHTTLLVEQPAAQADLADIFIESVADSDGPQIIAETHSEHIVLRLRRRVAEGSITPDKVALLFVERRGKQSTVRHLELDERGGLEDWPQGFFEESYQDALRLADAAARRD
jgi:predicted ATPase